MSITKWKVAKPATNYARVNIPQGALYTIMKEKVLPNGKVLPGQMWWTTDFDMLKKREHISVHTIAANGHISTKYVNIAQVGLKQAYENACKDPTFGKVRVWITRKDLAKVTPKDRIVGQYMYRGRGDSPLTMTHDLVTNNCKVGGRLCSNEMYGALRMGLK